MQPRPNIAGYELSLPVNGNGGELGPVVVVVGTVLPWCTRVLDVADTVVEDTTVVGWPILIEVVVSGMVTGDVELVVATTVVEVVLVVSGTVVAATVLDVVAGTVVEVVV
jgi:hypothetical protein